MTDNQSKHEDRLLAYIDGELSQAEQHAFEQELESNPQLNSRLQTLRTIEAGLANIAESSEPGSIVIHDPQGSRRFSGKWIGYAAALLIVATIFITMNPLANHETFNAEARYITITRTFEPQVVCDTPEKFASYTKDGYGKAIHADFDSPIQLVGWRSLRPDYNPEKSATERMTRILMAQTQDGTRMLAFFVPRGFPKPILNDDTNLYMHSKSLKGIRIYEVSPMSEPVLLDLLN
jgi:hypothetical protein